MQRPSPRFRSKEYFVYEISEECSSQIYRDLYGDAVLYTCQLFVRYKREIFILGVLGFLKTTRSFPKITEKSPKSSEEVRRFPKTSEVCRRRSYRVPVLGRV